MILKFFQKTLPPGVEPGSPPWQGDDLSAESIGAKQVEQGSNLRQWFWRPSCFHYTIDLWGDRWDSNPQMADPQSAALPLSHGHSLPCETRTHNRRIRNPLHYPFVLREVSTTGGTWTHDTPRMKRMLCQLSYDGVLVEGLEPSTVRISGECSDQLRYTSITTRMGLEPIQRWLAYRISNPAPYRFGHLVKTPVPGVEPGSPPWQGGDLSAESIQAKIKGLPSWQSSIFRSLIKNMGSIYMCSITS